MEIENAKEDITIKESIRKEIESDYLIISNREKCKKILAKPELEDNDLIDFFIAIHIVLEVGLNTFYRHIYLSGIQKTIDRIKIIKNVDNISFIDKTILFIYNSKFDFQGKIEDADKYHSILDEIKNFSEIRNKLLHGHSMATIYEDGATKQSELRKLINPQRLEQQVKRFNFIMEGMRFYFDCLKSNFSPAGKQTIEDSYLNDSFLNKAS
jgi:hypothetical protein